MEQFMLEPLHKMDPCMLLSLVVITLTSSALVYLILSMNCSASKPLGRGKSCEYKAIAVVRHRVTLVTGITVAGYSLSSSCLHIYSSVI